VSEGSEYEFRVTAINMFGAGEHSGPSEIVCAKNPNSKTQTFYQEIKIISEIIANIFTYFDQFPVKPRFKDPEDFMVVRSGYSIRIKIDYEVKVHI